MPGSESTRDLAVGLPLAALVGLFVGVLGTFKHQYGVSAATGAGFPTGLVLSLAMVAVLLLALRLSFPTRAHGLAAAAGVVVAVLVLCLKGPGGSVVVLQNAPGIVWTFAPAVVAAVILGVPGRRRRTAGRARADGILEADPSVEDRQ